MPTDTQDLDELLGMDLDEDLTAEDVEENDEEDETEEDEDSIPRLTSDTLRKAMDVDLRRWLNMDPSKSQKKKIQTEIDLRKAEDPEDSAQESLDEETDADDTEDATETNTEETPPMPATKAPTKKKSAGPSIEAPTIEIRKVSKLKSQDVLQRRKSSYRKDRLESLGASIEAEGLRNIPEITADGMIVTGERRVRAAKARGIKDIPVKVIEVSSVEDAIFKAWSENNDREDPSPLEKGEFFANLLENKLMKSASAIAKRIGHSPSYVTRHMKLMELSKKTQKALEDGTITMEAALATLNVKDEDEDDQSDHSDSKGSDEEKKGPRRGAPRKSADLLKLAGEDPLDQNCPSMVLKRAPGGGFFLDVTVRIPVDSLKEAKGKLGKKKSSPLKIWDEMEPVTNALRQETVKVSRMLDTAFEHIEG